MSCLPNDRDELRRIEMMGKTMDFVLDAILAPKPKSTPSSASPSRERNPNALTLLPDAAAGTDRQHYFCARCGQECSPELRHVRYELPDRDANGQLFGTELCWVSACCGDDYTSQTKDDDHEGN